MARDITPLDFFLWHCVEDILYRTKLQDIADPKRWIADAIEEGMLHRTWQEIEYRFDVPRAINGAHIEMH